jgi:hypothetical protein
VQKRLSPILAARRYNAIVRWLVPVMALSFFIWVLGVFAVTAGVVYHVTKEASSFWAPFAAVLAAVVAMTIAFILPIVGQMVMARLEGRGDYRAGVNNFITFSSEEVEIWYLLYAILPPSWGDVYIRLLYDITVGRKARKFRQIFLSGKSFVEINKIGRSEMSTIIDRKLSELAAEFFSVPDELKNDHPAKHAFQNAKSLAASFGLEVKKSINDYKLR